MEPYFLAIREIESITEFKSKLSTYIWDRILPGEYDCDLNFFNDAEL